MSDAEKELPAALRWLRRLLGLVVACVLLALLFQAAYYAVFLVQRIDRADENSIAESRRAERAVSLVKGDGLWGDYSKWPHIAVDYGPLAYYPVAWVLRLTGLPDGRWEQGLRALIIGRSISFIAMLGVLAWLYFMGRHLRLEQWWCLIAVLLFFNSRLVFKFADAYRSDLPMVCLALWAWFLVLRGRGRWSAIFGAVLMVLAFAYKPPALASAGLLGLWLVLVRDWRRMGWYGGVYAGALVFLNIALMAAASGKSGAMETDAIHANIYWTAPWEHILLLSRPFIMILPLAGGALSLFLLRKKRIDEIEAPLRSVRAAQYAFAGAFLLAALISMRPGSNVYYFLESWCWACLLTVLCAKYGLGQIADIFRRKTPFWSGRQARIMVWLVVLLIIFAGYGQRTRRLISERDRLQEDPGWAARNPRLAEILSNTSGEILLDQALPWWFSQSPPTLLMALAWSTSVQAGHLSPEPLIEKIRKREFELILLNYDARRGGIRYQNIETFPPAVNEAIVENYRMEYIEPYYLYRPLQP